MIQKIAGKLKTTNAFKSLLNEQSNLNLNNYSILYALFDDNGDIKKSTLASVGIETYIVSTSKEDIKEIDGYKVQAIMLGRLAKKVQSNSHIEVISINQNGEGFDEFIFVPFFDKLTKQNLISPTDESLALLSIDQTSHVHMGVEATFFSINNKFLSEEPEERKEVLEQIVEDINFIIPRITQPKGSANIITLLLNLENPVEEKAFIRSYKTVDNYTEVLFVTSDLKLLSGNLEEITYNGENIEGVYSPIIQRQTSKIYPEQSLH